MNTILIILLVIVGFISLLLIAGLFMKKRHYVKRSIVINAPSQQVFDFLKLLENQEKFNKWANTDPDRIKEFRGTDGTVGFVYAWRGGKKAGVGEKEIKNIVEGRRIETEIRFVKPMEVRADMIMETESMPGNQTRVSLTNTGELRYPLNILIPVAEKNFAKQLDESLSTLKTILEN